MRDRPIALLRGGHFAAVSVGEAERAQTPVARLGALPFLPADLPQPSPHPFIEPLERQEGIGELKVRRPTDREAVDLTDPPLHRNAPVACGQPPQPVLGSFESLRIDRDPDPAAPVAEEAKPQQGPLQRRGDRRLLAVDAQLQALLDVLADAPKDALPRPLACNVDPTVV